ncbi:hypothetical protein [Hahella ganghwensis]|uniref:hypothetical protein n=1 Tax=Hahella ganghwensis TaxID=286420 RepID=UPI00036A728B|nr:hypothetical protein [Hahella ganghwensis]
MKDLAVISFISKKFEVLDPFVNGAYVTPRHEDAYKWLSDGLESLNVDHEIKDLDKLVKETGGNGNHGMLIVANYGKSKYHIHWGWVPNIERKEHEIGIWKISIKKNRSFIDKLLGKNELVDNEDIVRKVESLFNTPDFSDIRVEYN